MHKEFIVPVQPHFPTEGVSVKTLDLTVIYSPDTVWKVGEVMIHPDTELRFISRKLVLEW
jgi:hypothetical protein